MSKRLKAYKYRIYPNNTQKVLLAKTFGCVRFFWNETVKIFNSYNPSGDKRPEYPTSTNFRKSFEWMKEVSAASIQQKEIDFKEYKKQKFSKGRKIKFGKPQLKKKSKNQSFRLPNQKFDLLEGRIRIEKIGKVKIVQDRLIPKGAKFMSVTISMNTAGQYFASVLVEQEIKNFVHTNKEVGIDVGLKSFFTTSDGDVVENTKYLAKSQGKLKKIQQHFSRKVKGSNRRKKCRLKIARLHQKIANQRSHFLHEQTSKLVNKYDVISIEDLNVSGMMKNRKLSKSIGDVSWSKFFNLLEYKADWYGKQVIRINRFAASSKTCNQCGWKNNELKLSDRTFICQCCGLIEDRDENAAKNILALGVDNAQRTQSECKTFEKSKAFHDEAYKL